MAIGQRVDPFVSFNFKVEIEGVIEGTFSEVTGLDSTIDLTEYREGGDAATPRKLPGMTKHSNIVLKRGLTVVTKLYDWHEKAVRGDVQRRDGSIIVLDRAGRETVRWNFFRAWPVKWDAPDLNATSNEVAVETLELAHEGLERAR